MKKLLAAVRQLPNNQKRLTISTALTITRIGLTPFIVAMMVYQQWDGAFILFVIAGITDLLDGYIARICNEQTFLGACLDPIADKVLLLSCFFTLAFVRTPLFTIPFWFVCIVLIKELIIIIGALFCVLNKEWFLIEPTLLGKSTAAAQMLFIVWLFSCHFFNWMPIKTYWLMLSLLLFLVLASLLQYIFIGIRVITNKNHA